MTEETNKPVQRHDRDLGTCVQDNHDETVRNIKEYLRSPILAKEANGSIPLVGDALRRHANLSAIKESEYTKLVREHREAKKS